MGSVVFGIGRGLANPEVGSMVPSMLDGALLQRRLAARGA
jgi:hypothetical protein